MNQCAEHAACDQAKSAKLPKRVIEIPTNPLHAPKLLLTEDEQVGQYVVLSHCWGSLGPVKLTDESLPKFQQGIPLEQLPKSFLDAFHITRELGFKYLWIDALCIIQDNALDWAEESPKMALCYGQSALMIAATAAEDSSKGILTERHVPYSPIMGKDKKYCLRQKLLRWDWDIEHSILSSRGWAAQERMLAPRVLHYTKRQMIWECIEGFQFEASGIKDTVTGSGQIDLRYHKSKIQPFVMQGLDISQSTSTQEQPQDSSLSPIYDPIARIRAWQQCADEFSGRDLTVSSDKLHAISGIASIMNHENQLGTYLAGLWSKHLAVGFTWSRPWALLTSPPEYRAPSWSWASLDGKVSTTVLASPPELLKAPGTAVGKRWAERFELELVEIGMILQDPSHPYGAVLEGSYIVVDATCITKDAMLTLSNEKASFLAAGFDKSNAADCPCCGPPDPEDAEADPEAASKEGMGDLEDDDTMTGIRRRRPPKEPSDAHFDIAMYAISDMWYQAEGFVDMVLLAWVDEEKKEARRTGFARMNLRKSEEAIEAFREEFMKESWERIRLKLI